MIDRQSHNKRIALNTLLLYARMIVVMLINLYTVRVVLHALGNEDYGIYNVVAGVITMLASFTGVFSSATQRFLSYSLGEGDTIQLNKIFSASLNIFVTILLISLLLGESIGLWFINTHLVIPQDRMVAANWIYQFSILSFMASMLSAPYLATSIAHENMGLFAIVTTIDAVLKLGFAFAIPYMPIDHLVFYGLSLLSVQIFTFFFYFFTCRRKYVECNYRPLREWKLHKEILTFSGWTLFSSFAIIGMNQGIAILINIFFGPLANASLAIALQINSALATFCNSFIMAVKPTMIKSYAEKRFEYLKQMFSLSNKFTYYCMLIIAIPLILEMPTVLHLWLGKVSNQTTLFCQLIVIYAIILSLCNPISIIVQATGKMKQFTIPVEMVTISTPIVVYFLFKLGFTVFSAVYSMILLVTIAQFVRLIFLKKIFPAISLGKYIIEFLIPAILVTIVAIILCMCIHDSVSNDKIRFFCICISSVSIIGLLLFRFGLNKTERTLVRSLLHKPQ